MQGAAGNAFAALWLQLTLTLQGSSHNGNSGETPASAHAGAAMPHRKTQGIAVEQASQSCLPPLPSKPASLPKPCSRASHSRHRTPLQLYVWSPQTQARERTGRDPRQKQNIVCSGSPSAIGSIFDNHAAVCPGAEKQRSSHALLTCEIPCILLLSISSGSLLQMHASFFLWRQVQVQEFPLATVISPTATWVVQLYKY